MSWKVAVMDQRGKCVVMVALEPRRGPVWHERGKF